MLAAVRRTIALLSVLSLLVMSLGHVCGHQEALADNVSYVTAVTGDASVDSELPDGNTLSGHHCGACTGVVLPLVATAAVANLVRTGIIVAPVLFLHPHGPALHTPPPKALT